MYIRLILAKFAVMSQKHCVKSVGKVWTFEEWNPALCSPKHLSLNFKTAQASQSFPLRDWTPNERPMGLRRCLFERWTGAGVPGKGPVPHLSPAEEPTPEDFLISMRNPSLSLDRCSLLLCIADILE
ncbi:hypothetical protein AVEN_227120-1 [Araneus ventricosus]|uniref:Uncharacterized protein n=1 Tax=Araneus ventricosus TaxID=182803 RepID=A0A4Y2BXK2_ARAVE|nr:hypothetical protein AVEN_227120-1 [Araneus ventricosus]